MAEYIIIVKGEAKTTYPHLIELDGISDDNNFAEYFDDDFSFEENIKDGYMSFRFDKGKLWTITEYSSNRKLNKEELNQLKYYTEGQWSDGIGEGFEQNPCYLSSERKEVYIHPWHFNQKITITQTKKENL